MDDFSLDCSVIMFLENDAQPYQFHTWMYFMVITTATVGYGDISPSTVVGRFAIMIMIAISIVTVPKMTNDLVKIMSTTSVYRRRFYKAKEFTRHVIVCGSLNSLSTIEFFNEFFHPDHNSGNLNVVVLSIRTFLRCFFSF